MVNRSYSIVHKSYSRHALLIALFFLLNTFSIFSQKIVLSDEQKVTRFGQEVLVYQEKAGESLNFDQISKANFDNWETKEQAHLNFGYSSTPIWLKITIENQSALKEWQLVVDMTFLDTLDFYSKYQGEWKHTQTGWHFPYDSRGKVKHRGFVFPIKPEQPSTYYIRVSTVYPALLPMDIAPSYVVSQENLESHISYGIYFGILLVMILYNFTIFLILQDRSYIYYVLTIVFTFITFAGVGGFLFKYLYPDIPSMNAWVSRAAMIGIVISSNIFTIKFLSIRKYKWIYYAFLVELGIAIIGLILNFVGISYLINLVVKIHTILLLSTGIYVWVKGSKFARFYVFAWFFYLVGGLTITMRNSGSLPINFWTNHGVEIGSVLEIVLLSIALADRYRTIRKEKAEAVKKSLEIEKQSKQSLEKKVRERTQKLNESNEELSQINEELSQTVETVERQRSQLASKNTAILDSINYAKRIQEAILPSQQTIQKYFADSFVFFKPKDVVSGDFYFFLQKDNHTFFAVADCTGHGVPGALMSMIGTNLLREIIVERNTVSPAKILSLLHQEILTVLKQKQTKNKDGLDIALCVINKDRTELCFAGAKNPLIYIENGELNQIKGSHFGVGGALKNDDIHFEDTTLSISTGQRFYMFSDGFQDQFGGADNRKFMRKRFRSLLSELNHLPCSNQKEHLEKTLDSWQGEINASQVDDILVVGFCF